MSWEKVSRGAKPATDDGPEMRISPSQSTINLVAIGALKEPTHIDIFFDKDKDIIMVTKGDDFKLSANGGKGEKRCWGKRRTFRSARLVELIGKRYGDCEFIREEAINQSEGITSFGLVFKAPPKD